MENPTPSPEDTAQPTPTTGAASTAGATEVTYVTAPPAPATPTVDYHVTVAPVAPKTGTMLQRFVHDPTVVRFFKGAIVTALSAVLLYTVRVLPSLNLFSGTDLSLVVGLLLALEKELQLPQ
jgi:hypothetical protein